MSSEFYGGKEKVPVVKVLIRNEKGEFLMLKKSSDYDWMGDKWEQPGGKIEGGDRFEAARREVREETGLQIGDLEDLVRIEIEDRNKLVNCYVLFTDEFSGEIELEDEHQDHRWISKKEALDLDWHRNAAYILPVIEYLEDYREAEIDYSEGRKLSVVKLLIQNDEGKFLAVKKSDEYGWKAGKWELPGGKQKEDNRLAAAKREMREETNLELNDFQDVMREEVESEKRVNAFILFCDDWEGEVRLSKEHVDCMWVSPEEYLRMDWHQDAGYGYPPMKFLDDYIDQ